MTVLLAIAGIGITALVGVGFMLLTPKGVVDVHTEGSDPKGSNLSPRSSVNEADRVPAKS